MPSTQYDDNGEFIRDKLTFIWDGPDGNVVIQLSGVAEDDGI